MELEKGDDKLKDRENCNDLILNLKLQNQCEVTTLVTPVTPRIIDFKCCL